MKERNRSIERLVDAVAYPLAKGRPLPACILLLSMLTTTGLNAAYHEHQTDPLSAQSTNNQQNLYDQHFTGDELYKQESPPPQLKSIPRPCSGNTGVREGPWVARTHLMGAPRVCNAALRFDRFFGDVRYDDDYATSFIRIRNNFLVEQDRETDLAFKPHIRARVHLPNAKERLNLIISDDSDNEDTLSTATETLSLNNQEPNRYSTTLRWIAEKRSDLEVDFDIGARFNNQLQLFVRNRYRKIFTLDASRAWRLTQSFYWKDQEGFGERTQLDYEHELNETWFFRFGNSATFSEVSSGMNWTQRFTFWQYIDYRTALSYSFASTGHTRPDYVTDEYGFSIRYRKQIYSHWLFFEAEPQLNWLREREDNILEKRETVPALILRFEVQLGYQ